MPNIAQFRERAQAQGFTDAQIEEYLRAQGVAEEAEPALQEQPTEQFPLPEEQAPAAMEQPLGPEEPAMQTEVPDTAEQPLSDAASGRAENRYSNYSPEPNPVRDDYDPLEDRTAAGARYQAMGERMRQESEQPEAQPLTDEQRQRAEAEGYTESQLAQYEAERAGPVDVNMLSESTFATPNRQFSYTPEFGQAQEYTEDDIGLLSPDRVRNVAAEIGVDPRTQTGINAVYSKVQRDNRQRTERALVRDLETITHVDRPYQWLQSQFGGAAEQEYEARRDENIADIIRLARDRGVELEQHDGEFYSRTEDGELLKVEPGFFESVGAAKYEAGGAMIGGTAGAFAGSALARNLNATGPWGRAITLGVAGGAALMGHVAGNQMDYLEAAIQVQEDWDAGVAAEKAVGSAQMGVLYEVAGLGAAKGVQLGAQNYRRIVDAFNAWRDKDMQGAIGYMRQSVGYISEEDGLEILRRWEGLNETQMPIVGEGRREMSALAITQPGAESLVRRASGINPAVGPAVALGPARRAQDLLQEINNITDSQTATRVLDDLSSYTREVKTQYDQVRTMGSDLAPEGYQFEFDPLTIQPLIERQAEVLADTGQVNRLINVLNKIDDATTTRSFDDLIELRQTLNQSKFSRAFASRNNQRTIQGAIDEIDGEINRVMGQSDEGNQWLQDWGNAKQDYAQMKSVEDNLFYKQLQSASHSNTADRVASALVRFNRGEAGDYEQVVSRLTPETQTMVEGEIINQLARRHTAGAEGQFQAINFPGLAREFDNMTMQTPDANRLVQVIDELAEVYRNDQSLVQIANSAGINFEQSIATSVKGKAKVAAVNRLWRHIRALQPGSEGAAVSAAMRLSRTLSSPLDAKRVGDLLEDRRINEELRAAFTRLQAETARDLSEGATPPARLFSDNRGRTFLEDGPGRRSLDEEIMPHRVIGTGDAKDILGVSEINYPSMTRANRLKLVDRGFQAIGFEDGQILRLDQ